MKKRQMIPYSLQDWLERLPEINSRSKILVLPYQVEGTYKALEAIHHHPGSKHTHASLAKIAGVNDRTLRRVFKDFVGMTIARYIRQFRLQEARAAISRGDNLDAVALMLGYNDTRHFRQLLNEKY